VQQVEHTQNQAQVLRAQLAQQDEQQQIGIQKLQKTERH
jgi:hypothetical protein